MRDAFKRTCQKNNHLVPADEVYSYRDVPHGIPETITICDDCLFEHVTKFYPGGTLESVLIDKHPEWKERLTKHAADSWYALAKEGESQPEDLSVSVAGSHQLPLM